MKFPTLACLALCIAAALNTPAFAIQTCELNGESVNPNNGGTTGKSGLMRCRDADTGVMVREQALQNGKFMGVVRHFKSGQLEREFSVNERGNPREGVSREWNVSDGKRVLVREESYANSKTIGIVRTWYPTGQRRRLGFQGDDETEQASVEFTAAGKLYALRCASRPVFGSKFDDKAACGHAGAISTVVLFGGNEQPVSRLSFELGERRKLETLWENGGVRQSRETNASGGVERSFAADGTKRRELQWVTIAAASGASAGARPRNIDTLEQEFDASGKLVHERKWLPGDRGAELVLESHWHLNGQLKTRSGVQQFERQADSQRNQLHDNGKPASAGDWLLGESKYVRNDSYGSPVGSHKAFDEQGRLRGERLYDDRGRIAREREFDERGVPVRDDEVFEDGSRKSVGK